MEVVEDSSKVRSLHVLRHAALFLWARVSLHGMDALDDEDKRALFAFKYGTDFPEALTSMTKAVLAGRPVNSTMGPVQLMKVL